jgi:hypothetical protein
MVQFLECDAPASDALIAATEQRVGLHFPAALRWVFQNANGGRPKPAIFSNETGRVWIDHCIPLRDGEGSAEWWYKLMVLKKQLVPASWFPFAIDPTGNVLYVDCASEDARVHTYLHDTAFEPMVDLGVGLEALWTLAVES